MSALGNGTYGTGLFGGSTRYYSPLPVALTGLDGKLHSASPWVSAPASSSAPGAAGQLAEDSTYLYVATGANAWGRIGLASF